MMSNMTSVAVVLFSFSVWLLCSSQVHMAADTLNAGEKISGNTTLVSIEEKFEVGFFSPAQNTSKYFGIWYYGLQPQTVVWVANRDKPIQNSTAIFQIAEDGNLLVSDSSGEIYWSSGLQSSSSMNRTAELTDSGNLVLRDNEMRINLWESFEHPTDTFLPFMKMDNNIQLISWRDSKDPGSGSYTFQLAQTGYTILKNNLQLHWEIGRDAMPPTISFMFTNFTSIKSNNITGGNKLGDYWLNRIVMNSTGKIEFLTYENDVRTEWNAKWSEPSEQCDIYNACGSFSSCNSKYLHPCNCLPGFQFISPETVSDGCIRKSASCQTKDMTFLNLTKVKVSNLGTQIQAQSETDCQLECINMCPQCQAYSYGTRKPDRTTPSTCLIWTQDLLTLQTEYSPENGIDLSVRLHSSDIESTPKTCKPCGTTIIPYPLSTGPDCGDPMYSKLSCDNSTGEVSFDFTMPTQNRVEKINPETRTLVIHVEGSSYCDDQNDKKQQLVSPFNVTNWCYAANAIEVKWRPPLEPLCNNSTDCNLWPHSSCGAARDGKPRCICNKHYYWNNSTLNCTQEESFPSPILKEPSGTKKHLTLILAVTLSITAFLACMVVFAYACRRKIARKKDMGRVQRIRGRFYDSERHVKNLINLEELEEKDNEGIEVPYHDFETILAATDNFSDENMVGRGGYGPVYKGTFAGGQDIAVKRLSNVSSQGLEEFKNEVVLISKLQHRNLVRLRGYCIKGDEKILLYEYMPNKSLDKFIFDCTQDVVLDWQMRFDIILGIARGMLYLHQDSRLRVVHRDLKTSNILLDEEMQPKISDFGLARIFGGKETEANTERVVGTYGYMSPEYALDGIFSIKSDVFSFGVMVLEIMSGKKNTGFFKTKQVSSLLGYAWKLWAENKVVDLMDQSLRESCNENEFIKCAQVGLLCVQDEPSERPTMSQVVIILESEGAGLPTPQQPTFFMARGLSSTASSSTKPEIILETRSSYQQGR